MQTNKAPLSSDHRTSSTPAVKPVQASSPASSSQPPSLTSRPEIASLFSGATEARDAGRQEHATLASSPKFNSGADSQSDASTDAGTIQSDDVAAASAINSGMKRTRDGKDGPEAKTSGTDQKERKKSSAKQRAKAAETAQDNDADSAMHQPTKRARKESKSVKSDKAHRPNSADDRASHTKAQSPGPKVMPPLALSNQPASSDAGPASPTSWKHGAQSPRANAANRASITLSPRRNSNASATERPAPSREPENPPADKPVAPDTASSRPPLPSDDFAFSACDLDTEGVMQVVSGSTVQGKDGQTTEVAAAPKASTPSGQQAALGQAALAPDMTALMDELEVVLEKPIGM